MKNGVLYVQPSQARLLLKFSNTLHTLLLLLSGINACWTFFPLIMSTVRCCGIFHHEFLLQCFIRNCECGHLACQMVVTVGRPCVLVVHCVIKIRPKKCGFVENFFTDELTRCKKSAPSPRVLILKPKLSYSGSFVIVLRRVKAIALVFEMRSARDVSHNNRSGVDKSRSDLRKHNKTRKVCTNAEHEH